MKKNNAESGKLKRLVDQYRVKNEEQKIELRKSIEEIKKLKYLNSKDKQLIKQLEKEILLEKNGRNKAEIKVRELKEELKQLKQENKSLSTKVEKIIESVTKQALASKEENNKKIKVNLRDTTSKKSKGGQKGHKGVTIERQTPTVEVILKHEGKCPECGTTLVDLEEKRK